MTDQAVQVIITVKIGDESREVDQSIALENFRVRSPVTTKACRSLWGGLIFEMLDTKIHEQRPKTWQSLGTAKRSLLTELGEIRFKRHIYWD